MWDILKQRRFALLSKLVLRKFVRLLTELHEKHGKHESSAEPELNYEVITPNTCGQQDLEMSRRR